MKEENRWKVTSCRGKVKTMGPSDGNESRLSLPVGVGNDKWVDRKNKAGSDCSVNFFWDPSGGEMFERSWVVNPGGSWRIFGDASVTIVQWRRTWDLTQLGYPLVLFGTLKVQSFILTEVSDCGLLIVVTSSTFLKRKDMLKKKAVSLRSHPAS